MKKYIVMVAFVTLAGINYAEGQKIDQSEWEALDTDERANCEEDTEETEDGLVAEPAEGVANSANVEDGVQQPAGEELAEA